MIIDPMNMQRITTALRTIATAIIATTVTSTQTEFKLPSSFLGTWIGQPHYSILGPFTENSYVFSVSKAENGDYLLENNVFFDDFSEVMGWQRFYIQGTDVTNAGALHYCGWLNHFSDFVEATGSSDRRLNTFYPTKFAAETDTEVTFCFDSSDVENMGNSNPFKLGCIACDCANWTFSYNPQQDSLTSHLVMSGNTEGSHHLWVEMQRNGPAPVVSASYMPGHNSDFTCDFESDGRDAVPVTRNYQNEGKDTYRQLNSVQSDLDTAVDVKKGQCPFLQRKAVTEKSRKLRSILSTSNNVDADADANNDNSKQASRTRPSKTATSDTATIINNNKYDHCYYLNKESNFKLSWTVDFTTSTLHCTVSASVSSADDYIAIGFRPMSRSTSPYYAKLDTGHHFNFAMAGADIITGSAAGGVMTMYAKDYTGAPYPDNSLKLANASVMIMNISSASTKTSESDMITELTFSRPFVGGYLYTNYGIEASIMTGYADIIWAVGSPASKAQSSRIAGNNKSSTSTDFNSRKASKDSGNKATNLPYHDNQRGLRYIDWFNPDDVMLPSWEC